MKSKLQKICKLTLECSVDLTKKNSTTGITQHCIDELEEAIELLSDIHEELYKSVFEDNCL